MGNELLRIATRKSELAMTQTRLVADRLVASAKALGEDVTYELVSMTTEGDRRLDKSLASFGGKGVFIKELEVPCGHCRPQPQGHARPGTARIQACRCAGAGRPS